MIHVRFAEEEEVINRETGGDGESEQEGGSAKRSRGLQRRGKDEVKGKVHQFKSLWRRRKGTEKGRKLKGVIREGGREDGGGVGRGGGCH